MAEAMTLGIEDLHEVFEAVFEVRNSWFSFGLVLGVGEPSLRIIESDCLNEPEACLRSLLSIWLRNCPNPSWNDIVKALRSKIVDHRLLSNKIIQSKPCSAELTVDEEVKEEANPEIPPPEDRDVEQLQTAFKMTAVVSKYFPVANWLENNDKIGKPSDSVVGNQGTELHSAGVPESEPFQESSTHIDVLLADNSTSQQEEQIRPPPSDENSPLLRNTNDPLDGVFPNEIEGIRKTKATKRSIFYWCCYLTTLMVASLIVMMLMFSGIITNAALSAQYRIAGDGNETILHGNEAMYLTRYSTVARLVDSVLFIIEHKMVSNAVDVYAIDCSRLSSFEHTPVVRNRSFSQPDHQPPFKATLDILYLVTNSTLNISVNLTANYSRLQEPNSNLMVVIFNDYTQHQMFVNYGSWTQAYETICLNNSSNIDKNVYISKATNYYITLFSVEDNRVELDYVIEGIVVSFNYSEYNHNCSLIYDDSTCSISVDYYSDQGASEVCFYAVVETSEHLNEKIVIHYQPSSTRILLLVSLPWSLVMFAGILLLIAIFVYVFCCKSKKGI